MIFTLTLPSDASTSTFPENTPPSYKVKLVNEIRLPEDDWEVALLTVSFPDKETVLKKSLLGEYSVVMKFVASIKNQESNHQIYVRQRVLEQALNPVTTGVSFWKKIIQRINYSFMVELRAGQTYLDEAGNTGMPEFKWMKRGEQYDFMIDNDKLQVLRSGTFLEINLPLAEAFGLVRLASGSDGRSFYVLGESIEMIHTTERSDGKLVDPKDYGATVDGTDKTPGVFWKVVKGITTLGNNRQDMLRLYGFCNWMITDINPNFQRVFGNENRTLFIYTDVAQPQIVGGKQTDMIGDVVYTTQFKGRSQFEPLHLHFIPIRKNVFDSIEVAVTEADGQLAEIRGGSTIVTLLFKRRSEQLL